MSTRDERERRRRRPANDADESSAPRRDTQAPTAPAPTPPPVASEAERQRQRLIQRADELRGSHWQTRRCERGHVIEGHRTNPVAADEPVRCPMCGSLATRETPEQTALREHSEASTPGAIIRRMVDALGEWATEHLNAETWTTRSDIERAARHRAAESRSGGYGPYDL